MMRMNGKEDECLGYECTSPSGATNLLRQMAWLHFMAPMILLLSCDVDLLLVLAVAE